jgi:hypothetical protein
MEGGSEARVRRKGGEEGGLEWPDAGTTLLTNKCGHDGMQGATAQLSGE